MTVPVWISVIALTISAGGFALQVRSWLMSGPRLKLSLMADAVSIPDDGRRDRLALIVINRGDTPTMLTHMVAFSYPSRWEKYRRKSTFSAVVNATNIPSRLDTNGQGMGRML